VLLATDFPFAAQGGEVRGTERAERGRHVTGVDGRDRLCPLARWPPSVLIGPAVGLEVHDRCRGAACKCHDRAPAGREILIRAGNERCPVDPVLPRRDR